jgi:hypothetical protein
MQKPTTRKRGQLLKSGKGRGLKPGIILKEFPREVNCSLKPVPEKTRFGACHQL